ncbi:MAG TPA: hypothetical protein VIK28_02880 [Sedimentisphaerales bacterium]
MKEILLYVILVGAFFFLPLIIVLAMRGTFCRHGGFSMPENKHHPKLKKKIHFSHCPWCKSTIELIITPNKAFRCSICECEFQHNYLKWVVVIPTVLIVCVVLLRTVKFIPPIFLASCSLIAVAVATRNLADYKIIQPGKNPPPEPQQSEAFEAYLLYEQSRQVSFRNRKQLIAVIFIIVLGLIMTLLLSRL